MYLFKLKQALEELGGVLQQSLAWFPVVIHLGANLLSSHLLWLDVPHDAHSLYHKLDTKRRPLEGTYLHHIIPIKRLEAGKGSILGGGGREGEGTEGGGGRGEGGRERGGRGEGGREEGGRGEGGRGEGRKGREGEGRERGGRKREGRERGGRERGGRERGGRERGSVEREKECVEREKERGRERNGKGMEKVIMGEKRREAKNKGRWKL